MPRMTGGWKIRKKLDFRFFLYCAARQQTFPESQLLEAWPASIYGHLREWTFSRVHENAHKLKNYTTRVIKQNKYRRNL